MIPIQWLLRLTTIAAVLPVQLPRMAFSDDAQIARGRYLVSVAGCNDCHTPGYFFGKPDMTRYLGGSDVGYESAWNKDPVWPRSRQPVPRRSPATSTPPTSCSTSFPSRSPRGTFV
jgi:hypothetical protein